MRKDTSRADQCLLNSERTMKKRVNSSNGLVKYSSEQSKACSSRTSPMLQSQADSNIPNESEFLEQAMNEELVAEMHTEDKKWSADNDESQSPLPLAKRPRSTWVDTLVESYDKLASEEARSRFLEKWAAKRQQRSGNFDDVVRECGREHRN